MKEKQIVKDESALDAQHRILEAARELFIQRGFAGTSMSTIASRAHVSRSLIFHHFQSKGALWQAVKSQWLNSHWHISKEDQSHMQSSLDGLLTILIEKRFAFYQQHPDYFILLCWQVVDEHANTLNQGDNQNVQKSLHAIKVLQQKQCIRQDRDASTLLTFLLGAIYGPWMLQKALPLNQQQQQDYLSLIRQACHDALMP